MKDTLKCATETKMKVKSEDQNSPPGEKDITTTFEKKNNLSEETMKKEQDKQEVGAREDNLPRDSSEVIVKKESNDDIDDLASQVKGIELSDRSLEADGKRKNSTELTTRGPNGGVGRPGSYVDSYNYATYNQQSELKDCSSNKRCFREEQECEPAKYYKPPLDEGNQGLQLNLNFHNNSFGTVNIKTPPVKTESYNFENLPIDNGDADRFIEDLLDCSNNQDFNDIGCLADDTSINMNNNLYKHPGPPSNQSDSGISGMSVYSPYQDIHSPESSTRSSASPPHMPEHVYSPQQQTMNIPQVGETYKEVNNADPLAGREEELQVVMNMIHDELLEDHHKKKKAQTQQMPAVVTSKPVKNEQPVMPQINSFNMLQQQTPPPPQIPIATSQPLFTPQQPGVTQPPQMFGNQPCQKPIILPPAQPGCIPQLQAVVRPTIMDGSLQGFPIRTMAPYTQPQIIIIQTPTQTTHKKMPRPIAPKTEKQTPIKKPGIQQQSGPSNKPAVPVVQVQPTPVPVSSSAPQQQRPVTKPQTQQNNTKDLNMARRLVAGIPSDHLKTPDDDGDTYLHLAACKNNPHMIQALLERLDREGLDWLIDVENKKRMTPLYLAVLNNQPEMVEIFLKFNAEPNALAQSASSIEGKCKEVKAPIHVAAAGGNESLQTLGKLLEHKDIALNIYNSEGHTALHTAIIAHGTKRQNGTFINSLNSIEALIKAGADPNSQDKKSGKTPLMYAIEKRDCMLIERMLRLFDPKKLRNVVKSQTFDGSNCLRIAEGRKSEFNPQDWQKLWDLLNKACTGELPRSILPVY